MRPYNWLLLVYITNTRPQIERYQQIFKCVLFFDSFATILDLEYRHLIVLTNNYSCKNKDLSNTIFDWLVPMYLLVSNLFFSPNQIAVFILKFEFLFHEDSQYTGVWKYCVIYNILYCVSKNRLYFKMLRIHLFGASTINAPRALAALAPLDLLIVNTLTNVL